MPEKDPPASQGLAVALLKPIMDLWLGRDERRAARLAGKLRFFQDGVLPRLEKVASGDFAPNDFIEMEQVFFKSEKSAKEAIEELREIRDRLGGSATGRLIDDILHNVYFGKAGLRLNVEKLFYEWKESNRSEQDKERIVRSAISVRNEVLAFNAAVDKLYRRAYDE
jgi:hypothetical protein